MSWKVVYTAGARRDLRGLYTYIAEDLCAAEAAAGQTGRIMEGIRSLSEMPMRYRLYEDEPWHSRGMRFFPVDNYLVFYLPEVAENKVYVIRIMYGGRDVQRQLADTKMEY